MNSTSTHIKARLLGSVLSAALLASAYSLTITVASAAISVSFSGSTTTPMSASETAGVVARSNWNNASGASSASALKLVDDTGSATNVTASWTSDNVWDTLGTDVWGNYRMMRGYLDNGNGNPSTVNVAGLTPGTYSIYVYVDGQLQSSSRTGIYRISGAGIAPVSTSLIDVPNTNFSGTLVPAANSNGNYVLFSNVTIGSGFTLTATPGATGDVPRAPVNGIQIIPTSVPAPDFTIAATPSLRTVTAGNSTTYSVTVGAVNGFAGTVSLSASGLPAGAAASFSPAAITSAGSSMLTVTTIGSTPAGTSSLTFKGTSGSLTHSAAATLALSAASPVALSVSFAGTGTTLMATSETAGVVAKGNWNNAPGAKSSSPLSLVSETGSTSGASMTWTCDNAWNTSISDVAGNNRMMRGYLDNGYGAPSTVSLSGVIPGKYNIYVYTDGDNGGSTRTGTYQISGSGIATTSISATDTPNTNFGGSFVQASNSTGNYVVFSGVTISSGFTLTATPGATSDVPRAPVSGIQIIPVTQDFSISVTPGSQKVTVGGKATWTVTIGALNGFNGSVTLSASGLPAGTSVSFSPASVTGSGSATATVTATSTTTTGTSAVTVSGTSGSLTHTAAATLTVGVNQPPTVSAGSAQAVSLGGTTQLSGTVTDDGLPNGTLTYSWRMASGPGIVTFGNAQSLSTTASFSIGGTYVLALTASDSTLTGSAQCTITVNAVTISLTPASTTLAAAQTRQFTPTVGGSSNTAVTWTLSSATGTISTAGLYTAPASVATNQTVTVKATSAADPSKSASAAIALTPALTITTTTLPNVIAGTRFSATLAATGGVSPYTWTLSSGNLPTGLTLTSSSGTISGTPAAGSYSFAVRVADTAGNQTSRTYSMLVGTPIATYYVSGINGNDSWSGLLPSPNTANTDGPFQTLGKAQLTMQASTTKTTMIRAGTYSIASVWHLYPQDAGESWISYPGETVILEGSGSGGVDLNNNNAGGVNHVTLDGLTIQNMGPTAMRLGGDDSLTVRRNTFLNCNQNCITAGHLTNSVFDSNTFNGQLPGSVSGPGSNVWYMVDLFYGPVNIQFTHNLMQNAQGGGLAMGGFAGFEPMNNVVDRNIFKSVNTNAFDAGAVYLEDLSGGGTGNRITNNLIMGNGGTGYATNQTKAIYLDDGTSNTLLSGNICRSCGQFAFQIHAGDHNTIVNNIFDLSSAGTRLSLYQSDTIADHGMAVNILQRNLIYFSGSAPSSLFQVDLVAGDALPADSNNLYYSGTGATIPNALIVDSSPLYANPLLTSPATGDYSMPSTSPAYTTVGFLPLATDQGPLVP